MNRLRFPAKSQLRRFILMGTSLLYPNRLTSSLEVEAEVIVNKIAALRVREPEIILHLPGSIQSIPISLLRLSTYILIVFT